MASRTDASQRINGVALVQQCRPTESKYVTRGCQAPLRGMRDLLNDSENILK